MWRDRRILDLLDIAHPIIQAPMADASNAELVAAVGEAGGLGSFGADARMVARTREPGAKVLCSATTVAEAMSGKPARGDADFIAMWVGQGVGLIRRRAAADLVNDLVVESRRLPGRIAQG